MKILMQAHTIDENGRHYPGEEIEVPNEVAVDYINRGLAIAIKELVIERAVVGNKEHGTGKAQRVGTAHAQPPEKDEEK